MLIGSSNRLGLVACLLFCAVALTQTACSPVVFTVANLPTHFDETAVLRDVSYGSLPSQKLDLYLPAGSADQPRDVVVFFYGGRWSYGAKEEYRFVGATFASKGYVVVIPDYRKFPEVRFPAFVEDGAKALAWVHDHIAASHGDPGRIHVVGHSAGAHIGALLTADARYLAREGKNRSAVVRDFVGLAGPYAFTPTDPDLIDMFGPPDNYPAMQVPTFVDGTQPPMLLLYGDDDTVVKQYNLDKLETRIAERGGCVRSIIYPSVSHSGLLRALSWFTLNSASVVDDIAAFFHSCGGALSLRLAPPWTMTNS
ncbi:MAG: alpha/beta hydrolase [Nitrospira sp.]